VGTVSLIERLLFLLLLLLGDEATECPVHLTQLQVASLVLVLFEVGEVLLMPVLKNIIAEALVRLHQRQLESRLTELLRPEHLDQVLLIVEDGLVALSHAVRFVLARTALSSGRRCGLSHIFLTLNFQV
jgi:hypothetical protein